MDTVLKRDPAVLAALQQEYEDMEIATERAEEEFHRRLRLQKSVGLKISEMLCPLVIGKLYRMKRGSYYWYAEREGWHFKIVRLSHPVWSTSKWAAKGIWCKKNGEPRSAFGNEMNEFDVDQDIIEQIDWEVTK